MQKLDICENSLGSHYYILHCFESGYMQKFAGSRAFADTRILRYFSFFGLFPPSPEINPVRLVHADKMYHIGGEKLKASLLISSPPPPPHPVNMRHLRRLKENFTPDAKLYKGMVFLVPPEEAVAFLFGHTVRRLYPAPQTPFE